MAANAALGAFLRSRRERLTPQAAGMRAGVRRRTAGLRREEVAERAGIGVDWYIRLEQGRAVRPPPATVDALARALRLTETEHAHLRALAREPDRQTFVREAVPDSLRLLVEGLNTPAYVTGRRWDVLCWNKPAAAMFPHFERAGDDERNALLFLFTDPGTKALFREGWEKDARRLLAQFRAAYDLWAGDPAFAELLQRLKRGSPEFSRWWKSHDVAAAGSGEKLLYGKGRRAVRYAYATFQSNQDPALRLNIYMPQAGR